MEGFYLSLSRLFGQTGWVGRPGQAIRPWVELEALLFLGEWVGNDRHSDLTGLVIGVDSGDSFSSLHVSDFSHGMDS